MSRSRRQFLADMARGLRCGPAWRGARRHGAPAGAGCACPGAAPAGCPRRGTVPRRLRALRALRRGLPYDTLKLARLFEPVTTGTPTSRRAPSRARCVKTSCVVACPSGALDQTMTDIDQARMGVAVLIDHETCLNYLGLRCDVCYRVCPLIDKAITLELQHNQRTGKHAMFLPTVHSDVCTGCGKCEHACVLEEAAIRWCLASSPRGDWPPLPARLGRRRRRANRSSATGSPCRPANRRAMSRYPGAEATARLGWWRSHRFLLLRRLCQFGVLTLFLLGPLAGIWILRAISPARCCWRRCRSRIR